MKYAVICASNQNRSMEAHQVLLRRSLPVHSYGTNTMIKLPGSSASQPNTYPFGPGTTYESIQRDLQKKDAQLYTQNGLLQLLERNKALKSAPERFQDRPDDALYDIIITCEERCFDIVGEDLLGRGMRSGRVVWVVNFDIRDTPEDAAVGARAIERMVGAVEEAVGKGEGEEGIGRVLEEYQAKSPIPVLYTVHFA